MRRDLEGADSGTSSSGGEEEERRWQREAKLHAAEAARRVYSAAASGESSHTFPMQHGAQHPRRPTPSMHARRSARDFNRDVGDLQSVRSTGRPQGRARAIAGCSTVRGTDLNHNEGWDGIS
jgi:hypothetical protein